MKANKILFTFLVAITILISCKKIFPVEELQQNVLDGTIDGLTKEENKQFLAGDLAFTEVFTKEMGLGSTFVSTSCISCHAGDGKGHPSTTLTRFGQSDEFGNTFLNQGGPQLQHLALPGFTPEKIPAGASSSKFTPPANTGLGFLDYVSDADLLALSDPNDADGDGISGVPNWVSIPNYSNLRKDAITENGKNICRFGKKASAYDLLHQSVNAYNQDMGITSTYNPFDVYSGEEIDPEITDQKLHDIVFYLRTLKAPVRRNSSDSEVKKGEQLFSDLKCTKCHVPTLKTGYSPIAGLSFKEFHPYTDLLLHDMGSALDDNYTEGSAKTYEWKTPPLWGLGLSKNSQGGTYFLLHDGRAQSLEEAINFHDGEGQLSKNLFQALTELDKESLYIFLESL